MTLSVIERNTSNIEMTEDGTPIIHESREDQQRRLQSERIDTIRDRISDSNYDPAEVSRLIAVEIAHVASKLTSTDLGSGPMATMQLKAFTEQVRALRELGKQLSDADVLSKKDVLNFDGPKFQYVLEIIVNTFVHAMKEAGTPEDMRTSIMKHFRDRMQMSENTIRKETAKIDSNKR